MDTMNMEWNEGFIPTLLSANHIHSNKMEVKIISKECIKPSSPTPRHLKTYRISLLDQFVPSSYVQAVLFYPIQEEEAAEEGDSVVPVQRSRLLKQSLSQTLARFYPLAGKIRDSLSVDCNDEGAHYVETHVGSNMLDFLSHPDNSYIRKFLPGDPSLNNNGSISGAHVALVQANVFQCGIIAVGVSVNHMILDGTGFGTFLKCWGDIARGCTSCHPDFTAAPSLFPQNDTFPKELSLMEILSPFVKICKVVTGRFVFGPSALAKLKLEATNSTMIQNPTSFEVVSALIWKCATKAFRANSGIQKPSLITHAMNLRRISTTLPISDNSMGNIVTMIIPQCCRPHAKTQGEPELFAQMVHDIREAKTKVKSGILEAFEGEKGFSNFCEASRKMSQYFSNARTQNDDGADFIAFTSWTTFGLYEVDFGWGKPVWATSAGGGLCKEASPMMNLVLLNGTRCGNGVEAWISLDEQDMSLVKGDEQLQAYCSFDPSPLHVCV